jgi:hypothetical protein
LGGVEGGTKANQAGGRGGYVPRDQRPRRPDLLDVACGLLRTGRGGVGSGFRIVDAEPGPIGNWRVPNGAPVAGELEARGFGGSDGL